MSAVIDALGAGVTTVALTAGDTVAWYTDVDAELALLAESVGVTT